MSALNGLRQTKTAIEGSLDKDVLFLKRLCKFSLILFRSNSEKPRLSVPKLLIAIALILADLYQAGYMLKTAFANLFNNVIASATHVVWVGKILTCLSFLVCWQLGSFQTLFSPQIWSNLSETKLKMTFGDHLQRYAFYFAFSSIAALILLVQIKLFVGFYFPGAIPPSLIGTTIYDGFERQTGALAIFLVTHVATIWLFVLFFYNVILSKINQKVRAFNEDVKQVYIYALIMVASNIIIMVLTLLIYVQSVMKAENVVIFTLSTVGGWIFELAALTIMPAKLHASIGQIEAEIFANNKIWLPPNEKIYLIANGIVAHAKQDGLGISLYGFASLTKPMILTTSSIIISYILLVGQISGNNLAQASPDLHG